MLHHLDTLQGTKGFLELNRARGREMNALERSPHRLDPDG